MAPAREVMTRSTPRGARSRQAGDRDAVDRLSSDDAGTKRSGDRHPAARRPGGRDLGDGALGRWSSTVYWFGATGLLLVLTTLPGAVPLMLLDRSAGNIPLVALCLIPLAPAISAALYALRDRDRGEGLTALRSFLRGYRRNAVDVLKLWLPALVVGTMIAISLANLEHAGVPGGYGLVLVVLAAMITVWAGNTLVIASFFSLRTRDIARLGVYYMARTPLAALGVLAMLLVAAGIVYFTFDAVLGLVGSILVWMLLRTCEPMLRHVQENFVA